MEIRMSNELQLINQQKILGKDFKVYGDTENPLFLAKDVADWIENEIATQSVKQEAATLACAVVHNKQTTQMVELIDDDEKLRCLINTSGQNREMWFLT